MADLRDLETRTVTDDFDWVGGSVKAQETVRAVLEALPADVEVYSLGTDKHGREHVDIVVVGESVLNDTYTMDGLIAALGRNQDLTVTPREVPSQSPQGRYSPLLATHSSKHLIAYRTNDDSGRFSIVNDGDARGEHLGADTGVVNVHLILAKKGSLAGQDMPYHKGTDFEGVANGLDMRKDVNYKKLN